MCAHEGQTDLYIRTPVAMLMTDIVYNKPALLKMTEVQLLTQVCLRHDRHFPSEESQLEAAAILAAAQEKVSVWAAELNSLGYIEKATELKELLD